MSGAELKPCGGCGETDPSKRCIGCLHDFGNYSGSWVKKPIRTPAQIRADALREVLSLPRYEPDFTENLGDRSEMKPDPQGDWISAASILALLATPLSPTAVDGSPAPDAGGKEDK